MDATLESPPLAAVSPSTAARWGGRGLTGVAVLFLTFDATVKLAHLAAVTESSARLGLPDQLNFGVALVELACLALYLVPRTAALGAVLLTGYLGGAVALHVRVGDPLVSHVLFPVYVGAVVWVGLFLRDARVRRLLAPADRQAWS